MQETLQLTFRTSRNTNRVMNISDPRPEINELAARSAADLIIIANPFDAETGTLVSLAGAQRIAVSRQVIIAPEAV